MKTHITILTAAIFTALTVATYSSPANWPPSYPTHVTTKEQAMKCCLPKEKVEPAGTPPLLESP